MVFGGRDQDRRRTSYLLNPVSEEDDVTVGSRCGNGKMLSTRLSRTSLTRYGLWRISSDLETLI
jgi:hypothetical protein